jgi:solute carrier family 50 protein (sugar transporter)
MIPTTEIILEIICPALGVILANAMFFASYKDVKLAVARGSLGDLNPTPWAFMLGNCCGWVIYSFLLQNLWIFFADAPGFVLSVWLNLGAAKLQYQDHHANEMRKSFANYLGKSQKESQLSSHALQVPLGNSNGVREEQVEEQAPDGTLQKAVDFGKIVWDVTSAQMQAPAPHENVVLVIVVIWVAVISIIAFADFSQSTKELIVGVVLGLNVVFFYGAPLSTILIVMKSRNSASIHVWTMFTNTANALFWFAYGLAVLDPIIYVPNGIGLALGAVQIILFLSFPRIPNLPKIANESRQEEPITIEQEDKSDQGLMDADLAHLSKPMTTIPQSEDVDCTVPSHISIR